MTVTAASFSQGPAIFEYKNSVFFCAGDATVEEKIEYFTVPTPYGDRDKRYKQKITEITFTPVGAWTPDDIATLYPYLDSPVNTNMFANASTCICHSFDGNTITVPGCAVVAMPTLKLAASSTMIGAVTLRSYQPDAANWSRHTLNADAFTSTGYSDATIPTLAYYGQWGATEPWDNFETDENGFEMAFAMQTSAKGNDRTGTLTEFLQSVSLEIKVTPCAATTAQMQDLLKAGGEGVKRGARMAAVNGNDLFISGFDTGDPTFAIDCAVPLSAPVIFGPDALRGGQVVFGTERSITNGTFGPLMTIGTKAA